MTDPYRIRIYNTENEYLPVLYDYCKSLFDGINLPSHNHLHHYRVWLYAKDLLFGLSDEGRQLSPKEISLLMLAIFFHDTGLTKTLDEDHGRESRRICEEFLINNPDAFSFNADEALKAIEMHDKKEMYTAVSGDSEMDLLKTLSICDDIDAYGSIGILRYAEIYILRGISINVLANKVLKNLKFRVGLFISQQWIPEPYLAKHIARYRHVYEFYEKMKQPDSETSFQNSRNILESYMNEVYSEKSGIMKFASKLVKSDYPETAKFGSSLLSDLHDYSLTCR